MKFKGTRRFVGDRGKKKSVSVQTGLVSGWLSERTDGEGRLSDCDRRLRDVRGGSGSEAAGIRIQASADPGSDREKRRQDPHRDAG